MKIDEIKACERMIKETEIEYAEKVECLREKLYNLTQSLADSIATNFSNKFMPCDAFIRLDYKFLKLHIDYKDGDDNGFFDDFSVGEGWLVRIKANFSPKEKFDEGEIAEWFKGILTNELKIANENEWNYDDNNEIQQNSNVRRRK